MYQFSTTGRWPARMCFTACQAAVTLRGVGRIHPPGVAKHGLQHIADHRSVRQDIGNCMGRVSSVQIVDLLFQVFQDSLWSERSQNLFIGQKLCRFALRNLNTRERKLVRGGHSWVVTGNFNEIFVLLQTTEAQDCQNFNTLRANGGNIAKCLPGKDTQFAAACCHDEIRPICVCSAVPIIRFVAKKS